MKLEEKLKTDKDFRWLNEIANKQLRKYVRMVRSNDLIEKLYFNYCLSKKIKLE